MVKHFAATFSDQFNQPVTLFGNAVSPPDFRINNKIHALSRDELSENIRMGLMKTAPDKRDYNPKQSLTLIGLRKYVVTFVLYLDTSSTEVAQEMADIVGSGGSIYFNQDHVLNPEAEKEDLREERDLRAVNAVAVNLGEETLSQIICYLKDYEHPTLVQLYRAIDEMSHDYLVEILGTGILGYIPLHAFHAAMAHLPQKNKLKNLSEQQQLNHLFEYLQLNSFGEFISEWQIIDYRFREGEDC